jgi:citrate lyase subunit beta/citryl-CoA lyase
VIIRSFLFVPGDSEKKLGKSGDSGADALILDLEDAVTGARKAHARALVADHLRGHRPGERPGQLWVRINPLDSGLALADLQAVVPGEPDGIVLPKCAGPESVQQLSHYLEAFETAAGLAAGGIRLLPLVTESASSALTLARYHAAALPRVFGLTWGAEDLSADLGATGKLDDSGELSFTYKLARSQTLLAARALGVQPIETLYADFKDDAGLAASSRAAYREGFSGRLAIHPAQVPVLNEAFLPSASDLALAERIVQAFAAAPDAGTVGIDGSMYDRPHLQRARQVLALIEKG